MDATTQLVAKAKLLGDGEVLYKRCLSIHEGSALLNRLKGKLLSQVFEGYSLVPYTKKDESGTWWLCIAKVPVENKVYIKKPSGELAIEEDGWVTKNVSRMFKLAIQDGKSREEILSLATTDLERKYALELLKGEDLDL